MLSKIQYPLVSYMEKYVVQTMTACVVSMSKQSFAMISARNVFWIIWRILPCAVFDERCAILSSVLVNIRKKRKDPVNIFGYIWLRNNHLKWVQELVLQENLNSWVRVQVCFLLYFCKCQITCQLYFNVPIKSNWYFFRKFAQQKLNTVFQNCLIRI